MPATRWVRRATSALSVAQSIAHVSIRIRDAVLILHNGFVRLVACSRSFIALVRKLRDFSFDRLHLGACAKFSLTLFTRVRCRARNLLRVTFDTV